MSIERIHATPEHIAAILRACEFFGSQINLANFLGLTSNGISNWKSGRQVIPLHHAEALAEKMEGETVLSFRPDIKKYEKYFK